MERAPGQAANAAALAQAAADLLTSRAAPRTAVWHVPNGHRTLAPHPGGHRGRRAGEHQGGRGPRRRLGGDRLPRAGPGPARSCPAGPRRL